MPFIFFAPDFKCADSEGVFSPCSEEKACSNIYGYMVDTKKTSMVSEFKMWCENKHMLTNGMTFVFFLAGSLVMVFSVLTDYLGRLPIFYFCGLMNCIGCILAYFSISYYPILLGVALCFTGVDLSCNNIFIYINEVAGRITRCKIAK